MSNKATTAKHIRRALITGAAGGIGRALVLAFQQSGYQVLAVDKVIRPAELDCWSYCQIDLDRLVADERYRSEAFTSMHVLLEGEGLNVLINNAAVQVLGGVNSLSARDWQLTLNVNLVAPFLLSQVLLQQLERSKGCVINISSIHSRLTKPNFVAYATSKAALSGMTRAMAVDLGGRIRVNAIEPGAIGTDMLKAGFAGQSAQFKKLESCHPQGRIGEPAEIAALALSMASGGLGFLHGSCVSVDGGIGGRLHDPS